MELRSTTASPTRSDTGDASLVLPRTLLSRIAALSATDPDRRRSLQQDLQMQAPGESTDPDEQAAILRSTHEMAWRLLHLSQPVSTLLKPAALSHVPAELFHQVDQEV